MRPALTVGLLTANISVSLMGRWGMKRVALICWLVGRGSFVLTAFAFNPASLLIIFTLFWLLESWPAPAYVQTIQLIYPIQQCGRILAAVPVGLVALTLVGAAVLAQVVKIQTPALIK